MNTENTNDDTATEGCAPAAGYVAEPLKIVEHHFRPTTGVKAADDYIQQAVAEVMRDLTPLIVERVTEKMAMLLEAKRLPRRPHTSRLRHRRLPPAASSGHLYNVSAK